ncbi:MAG: ribosomal protein S18-alanine N-acetyltransferase [Pseudomonadota bacterium]|nr:ribosomal protein S18-alanine N-acetyltransferase [Pseudomonadota bacterium]
MNASACPAQAAPGSAVPALRLAAMQAGHLDAVLAIEQRSHGHPWTRGHFLDTLAAGHHAQCLLADDTLLGYLVAMPGYREAHLLNLTIAPEHRRQGFARLLLTALAAWARTQQAEALWLEVRASNTAAQQLYARQGFARVGLRKHYYPAGRTGREDAVLMRLDLEAPAA